jgi:hypothetical protein
MVLCCVAFAAPVKAADCILQSNIVAQLSVQDDNFYVVPADELPVFLDSVKGYLGGNIDGITGAIVLVRGSITYLGVERGGCFSPKPIPMLAGAGV